MVLVIRKILQMTEGAVLGKRISVELLKSSSACHVASAARLNIFGLQHRVALQAR
jgi:hypothetical protein